MQPRHVLGFVLQAAANLDDAREPLRYFHVLGAQHAELGFLVRVPLSQILDLRGQLL